MRTTPGTRRATVAMDVMPPWRAFGPLPSAATHDARRWLRPVLLALAGIGALAALLGSSAHDRSADAAPHRAEATR